MSEMQSTVEYRDVPGFPGYRVGDDGSVWTAWTRLVSPGLGAQKAIIGSTWVRKGTWVNEKGYLRVHLRNAAGRKTSHYVHRVVLLAFVGPCPAGLECLHGAGGSQDNRLANLRWGTHKDNIAEAVTSGAVLRGESQPNAKLTDAEAAEAIRLHTEEGQPYSVLAARFGIGATTMSMLIKGETWRHVPRPNPLPTPKINPALIAEIRACWAAGESIGSLSRRTTVARDCVRRIVHRKGRYADAGGTS
jgi:hypothetical protein